MRTLCVVGLLLCGLAGLGLYSLTASDRHFVFESLGSKTEIGAAVFNEIKLVAGRQNDIWLMHQSHNGLIQDVNSWDRLAIVVDKTKRPYQARFYQFSPGRLEMANLDQAVPYKARCFACDSNGPRAIRPNISSREVRLGILNQMQAFAWNLRIKTYGRVESIAGQTVPDGAPFKSNFPVFSRPLGLASCTKCHSGHGIRNELKLEQAGTANFLVSQGLMPPFPFKILDYDRRKLESFIK